MITEEPQDQVVDATRRTHLANERTYLAWLRTGLAAFAVAIGVGKVVPAITDDAELPYVVVGIGFAVLGVALVVYGLRRMVMVQTALAEGRYAGPGRVAIASIAALTVVLGAALMVLFVIFG